MSKVIFTDERPSILEVVMSLHHACLHALSGTPSIKLIENLNGQAFVQQI